MNIIFVSLVEKTGYMSDFISLFFTECSIFRIKNSLKTFQSIVYALKASVHTASSRLKNVKSVNGD